MGKIGQGLSMGADDPALAVTRRGFLKGSGGTALALTMTQQGVPPTAGKPGVA